jgi:hypothetical protein
MAPEQGERERIAMRRRFVMERKAHDSMGLDAIVDAWNAQCVADGRPDDQRGRATIAIDLKEGLRILTEDTKVDAAQYRDMLTSRIEHALSRPNFVAAIDRGDFNAVDRLLKATSQLAQLHGANMPTKIAETDSQGNDLAGLTDDERSQRVLRMFEIARQRQLEAQPVDVAVEP